MKTLIPIALALALALALACGYAALHRRGDLNPAETQAAAPLSTRLEPLVAVTAPAPESPSATKAGVAPLAEPPKKVDPFARQIEQVNTLSKVVFKNADVNAKLESILSDPEFKREIRTSLNDSSTYAGAKFTRKLRLLDAMYEGLKHPRLNQEYLALTKSVLEEQPAPDIAASPELHRQFIADRAEIALVLMKAEPKAANGFSASANPNVQAAFQHARDLSPEYQIAM